MLTGAVPILPDLLFENWRCSFGCDFPRNYREVSKFVDPRLFFVQILGERIGRVSRAVGPFAAAQAEVQGATSFTLV